MQEIIPGLSKLQIDDVRTHADLRGPGKHVNPPEIHRMRLETTKTDHFLEFISTSSLLQDVSHGTKTIKLDSGEKLLVPAAIRTLIPSRIIKQYQSYCDSVDFKPYSERTLFPWPEISDMKTARARISRSIWPRNIQRVCMTSIRQNEIEGVVAHLEHLPGSL